MTTDQRSGLCHGPQCTEKITEASASTDFCSDGCQARWSAALVGAEVDPGRLVPVLDWTCVGPGVYTAPLATYQIGQRLMLGDEEPRDFEVTESEPGRAVLTPLGEQAVTDAALSLLMNGNVYLSKPIRRSWWKPNTWRRS